MLLIFVLILVFFFIIINISFVIILNNNSERLTSPKKINFSIVIAVKNEEKNITTLLSSLQKLNYPEENFEVIIIDDNSADKTYEVTKGIIQSQSNFHLFKIEEKKIQAKKGALSFGIKKAANPFILITDADCQSQENWLMYYSEKFQKGYDFLFGNAPFYNDSFLVNKISCFENLRSSILTFFAAKKGFPYSASARNFGFKKSSFEKIKGYSNTTETLSGDDDLLLREAVKNNLRIGTVLNSGSFIYSTTKSNLTEYLNQRARHTKTSFYYLPGRQFFLSYWHLLNLFFLFSPLLLLINKFFGLLLFLKLLIDSLIIKSLQKKFGYRFSIIEILYLQVIYEVFLIVHFINALFKKDKWN